MDIHRAISKVYSKIMEQCTVYTEYNGIQRWYVSRFSTIDTNVCKTLVLYLSGNEWDNEK